MQKIKVFNKFISLTPARMFILVAALLLMFSVVLRILTPEIENTPDIQSVPQIEVSNELSLVDHGSTITISTKLPDIPKEVVVYSTNQLIDLPILAEAMAKSMGLVRVKNRNYVWRDFKKTSSIIYSEHQRQITFFNSVTVSDRPIQLETAILAAKNFVQKNVGISNLQPDLSTIRIDNIPQNENHETKSLPSGNLIEIKFAQQIGGFDLIYNNSALWPVEITVGPDHQIIKAVINWLLPDAKEVSKQKTLSGSEIINAIEIGQGTIIYLDDGTLYSPIEKKISAVNLTEAVIEYRSYGNSGMIYPYLKFSGKALLENSRSAMIEIIYPIVRTTSS